MRKLEEARRLLAEGLRELAEAGASNDDGDPATESISPSIVKVSDTDRARARARLRQLGVRV
jgi:hypothetical protein